MGHTKKIFFNASPYPSPHSLNFQNFLLSISPAESMCKCVLLALIQYVTVGKNKIISLATLTIQEKSQLPGSTGGVVVIDRDSNLLFTNIT
jgi:hypothetical protein